MRKVKKLSIWVSIGFVIIVVLAAVSLFLAQRIVSREDMKEAILAYLSEKIGGEVAFDSLDIHFFYRPHVLIRKGAFSVPDKIEGSFENLLVYPKVLPLLEGRVEVSTLRIYRPDFKVFIKEEPQELEASEEKDFPVETLKATIAQTLAYLDSQDRGTQAEIKDGSLVLQKDGTEVISLDDFNASLVLPDDKLSFSISSNSSLWDRLDFKGWINVKNYKGLGSLVINGFEPHKMIQFSFPDNHLISDSSVNLTLKYNTHALSVLNVKLEASVPYLTLSRHGTELQISAKDIYAELYFDEEKKSVTLNNADLVYPEVNLSGKLGTDMTTNTVSLSLRGNNVDVESCRRSALFVAGGNRIVDIIFDVVRGGTVPGITLDAKGGSFRDLWSRGNFVIKGNMTDGEIHIPVAEFDIAEAKGNAVIGDGVLKGTGLSGRLGNSQGYEGTLLVGTEGGDGPLNLEVMVDADPAQIPPVLGQFVNDEVLLNELPLIKNVSGNAKGKLVLRGTKKSPDTVVRVSDFDITAEYDRFPSTVHVKGGKFNYDDKKVDVEALNVAIGGFRAPNLSGSFSWKDGSYLGVSSGDTEADLGEVFPWLSSMDSLGKHLRKIKSVNGSVFFSSVEFEGPLSEPLGWRINAEGRLDGVNLGLNGSNDLIKITSAEISSTQDLLSVTNADATLENSAVSLEMALSNYFTDLLELRMNFEGTLEAPAVGLFSDYVKLPEELVFEGPLLISDSQFVFRRNGNHASGISLNAADSRTLSSGGEFDLSINIQADAIEWKDSDTDPETRKQESEIDGNEWNSPVSGKVGIKSRNFKYKDLNWGSLDAIVTFLEHGVDIDISEASLCGISTPGFVNVSPPSLKYEFRPFSNDENLADVLKCLLDKAGIMSGEFDFKGDLYSDGRLGDLFGALQGGLELNSENGHVNKFGGIAKFFTFLNFGELFRGQSPDFGKDGFHYDRLFAIADIKEGRVMIKEAVMDGPSLKVVCEGDIDLVLKKLDLQVMVIPILAVDSVINKIPLVSYVLGDDYVSIPVKVTGDISNPEIKELSPSALRFGLLGIVKQTLNIPVTLIKPLNKKQDTGENADGKTGEGKAE